MKRGSIAALVAAITVLWCAAVAAAAVPTLITTDPDGGHGQHPASIFLAADAGPELVHIHWSGWGTATAVGRGTLDQGETSGGGSGPATITLTGLYTCTGARSRTYARGVLTNTFKGKRYTLRFPAYAPIAYCAK